MATWDFGGGCPCGVNKVCDCKNAEKDPAFSAFKKLEGKTMAKSDFDFGFSTHSEEELTVQDKTKLYGLKDMIMPLLNNLMKDSDKDVIRWPNRKQKIEEFIKKIDDYIEN